jgi:hypothetical protein
MRGARKSEVRAGAEAVEESPIVLRSRTMRWNSADGLRKRRKEGVCEKRYIGKVGRLGE